MIHKTIIGFWAIIFSLTGFIAMADAPPLPPPIPPMAPAVSDIKPVCSDPAKCAQLLPAAEKGDAQAQFDLGKLYYYGAHGADLKASTQEAIKWYRKAAEQNHIMALSELSNLDMNPKLTGISPTETIRWWRKIADSGNQTAQNYIGYAYSNGNLGVEENPAEAVKWWMKAAAQGNSSAQLSLYTAYCYGNGVPQDTAEAEKWFQMANTAAVKANAGKLPPMNAWGVPIKKGCDVVFVN